MDQMHVRNFEIIHRRDDEIEEFDEEVTESIVQQVEIQDEEHFLTEVLKQVPESEDGERNKPAIVAANRIDSSSQSFSSVFQDQAVTLTKVFKHNDDSSDVSSDVLALLACYADSHGSLADIENNTLAQEIKDKRLLQREVANEASEDRLYYVLHLYENWSPVKIGTETEWIEDLLENDSAVIRARTCRLARINWITLEKEAIADDLTDDNEPIPVRVEALRWLLFWKARKNRGGETDSTTVREELERIDNLRGSGDLWEDEGLMMTFDLPDTPRTTKLEELERVEKVYQWREYRKQEPGIKWLVENQSIIKRLLNTYMENIRRTDDIYKTSRSIILWLILDVVERSLCEIQPHEQEDFAQLSEPLEAILSEKMDHDVLILSGRLFKFMENEGWIDYHPTGELYVALDDSNDSGQYTHSAIGDVTDTWLSNEYYGPGVAIYDILKEDDASDLYISPQYISGENKWIDRNLGDESHEAWFSFFAEHGAKTASSYVDAVLTVIHQDRSLISDATQILKYEQSLVNIDGNQRQVIDTLPSREGHQRSVDNLLIPPTAIEGQVGDEFADWFAWLPEEWTNDYRGLLKSHGLSDPQLKTEVNVTEQASAPEGAHRTENWVHRQWDRIRNLKPSLEMDLTILWTESLQIRYELTPAENSDDVLASVTKSESHFLERSTDGYTLYLSIPQDDRKSLLCHLLQQVGADGNREEFAIQLELADYLEMPARVRDSPETFATIADEVLEYELHKDEVTDQLITHEPTYLEPQEDSKVYKKVLELSTRLPINLDEGHLLPEIVMEEGYESLYRELCNMESPANSDLVSRAVLPALSKELSTSAVDDVIEATVLIYEEIDWWAEDTNSSLRAITIDETIQPIHNCYLGRHYAGSSQAPPLRAKENDLSGYYPTEIATKEEWRVFFEHFGVNSETPIQKLPVQSTNAEFVEVHEFLKVWEELVREFKVHQDEVIAEIDEDLTYELPNEKNQFKPAGKLFLSQRGVARDMFDDEIFAHEQLGETEEEERLLAELGVRNPIDDLEYRRGVVKNADPPTQDHELLDDWEDIIDTYEWGVPSDPPDVICADRIYDVCVLATAHDFDDYEAELNNHREIYFDEDRNVVKVTRQIYEYSAEEFYYHLMSQLVEDLIPYEELNTGGLLRRS